MIGVGLPVADMEYVALCRANMKIYYKQPDGTYEAIEVLGLYAIFSKVACSSVVVQSSTRLG